MTETPLEMWWPTPEALVDLTVEDDEEGFTLSAPDGTDCSIWLQYWNQSEEHLNTFNEAFKEMLQAYLSTLDYENGEDEELPHRGTEDRVETQDDLNR